MNNEQLLSDARTARRYLNKVISRLETGDTGISFMASHAELEMDTVKLFIDQRIGFFQSDLMTATDMVMALNDPANSEHLLVAEGCFTAPKIGRMVRKLGMYGEMINKGKKSHRVLIVRNAVKYDTMSSKLKYDEYVTQRGLSG